MDPHVDSHDTAEDLFRGLREFESTFDASMTFFRVILPVPTALIADEGYDIVAEAMPEIKRALAEALAEHRRKLRDHAES